MPTPLYDTLRAYAAQAPARFHMPGHKGKFLPAPELNALAPLDVTEVPGHRGARSARVHDEALPRAHPGVAVGLQRRHHEVAQLVSLVAHLTLLT